MNDTYIGLVEISGASSVKAYIKDLPPRQLANELLAACLAISVGLPVPRPILAIAHSSDFVGKHGPELAGERLVFASSDEGASSASLMISGGHLAVQRLQEMLLAWKSLPVAIAFDSWIANGDRHHGNFLLKGSEVCLVDHSHAFTGPSWTAASLATGPRIHNQLAMSLRAQLSADSRFGAFMSEVDSCETGFSTIDLSQELLEAHLSGIVGNPDLVALSGYLASRVSSVAKHVASELGRPRLS